MTKTVTTTTTTTTVTTTVETTVEPKQYKKTRIVVIGDRSGSMSGMINDAIGGVNTFVEEQKKLPGEATFSLVLFDSVVERAINEMDLQKVQPITSAMWYPRGMTSLLDAVGQTISALTATNEPDTKTIVSIMTDGEENSSREFTHDAVKALISKAEDELGFDVMFMGANINVNSVASSIGIKGGKFAAFEATGKGMSDTYTAMSLAATSYRGFAATEDLEVTMARVSNQ